MSKEITVSQVSAGGVAVNDGRIALIKTVEEGRWQLPKGMIDPGETPEQAALREVNEEAGIKCDIIEHLETIEYWFYGTYDGPRKRYHKKVHFYLMNYISGNVADHDHEVIEARWVPIDEAHEMLAFQNEKDVLAKAVSLIEKA
jgi:mutator protein MutT